jgi:hypothetical protein
MPVGGTTVSGLRQELERLRREVDRLMERLDDEDSAEPPGDRAIGTFESRVKKARTKNHGGVAVGVSRVVVLADRLGGTAISDSQSISSPPMAELPSDEKLLASATVLAHTPFQMRAMNELVRPAFEANARRLTKAALAAAMGVDETELERELAPLVEKKTLIHSISAEGEEVYELKRWDLFWLQLSFVT